MSNILWVVALICLFLAAVGVAAPVNLIALGLALWLLSEKVTG